MSGAHEAAAGPGSDQTADLCENPKCKRPANHFKDGLACRTMGRGVSRGMRNGRPDHPWNVRARADSERKEQAAARDPATEPVVDVIAEVGDMIFAKGDRDERAEITPAAAVAIQAAASAAPPAFDPFASNPRYINPGSGWGPVDANGIAKHLLCKGAGHVRQPDKKGFMRRERCAGCLGEGHKRAVLRPGQGNGSLDGQLAAWRSARPAQAQGRECRACSPERPRPSCTRCAGTGYESAAPVHANGTKP